jgi:branched-chain amino acid aminotransferase
MTTTALSPTKTATAPKYWIDGRIVSQADAVLPVGDLGFSRGYAAFDALRTYDGKPFLLDAHLARFERTCELLSLKLPVSRSELAGIVAKTLAANSSQDCLIRIYLTGGDAGGFIPEGRERLMVLIDPVRAYPARQFTEGIALARSMLGRTFPLAKSTTYLAGVWETIQARRRGFDEVVFCNAQGDILEGTTFSVGVIQGRELITPREDILHAITMEHLVGVAAADGLQVTRAPLSRAILAAADEVFITSSTRELIPVSRIDDERAGLRSPGTTTRRLHELYLQSIREQVGG